MIAAWNTLLILAVIGDRWKESNFIDLHEKALHLLDENNYQ